jgi:hypothetical protein
MEFAQYYLDGLRFLYRESYRDDKKVCEYNLISSHVLLIFNIYILDMEGALLQPLRHPDLCGPSRGY